MPPLSVWRPYLQRLPAVSIVIVGTGKQPRRNAARILHLSATTQNLAGASRLGSSSNTAMHGFDRQPNQGTKLHFKSPTAERRHASCVGGWRGSNPRRPAPMEQGMPALTSRLLQPNQRERSPYPLPPPECAIAITECHASLSGFIVVFRMHRDRSLYAWFTATGWRLCYY